jgi:hypothetical protein
LGVAALVEELEDGMGEVLVRSLSRSEGRGVAVDDELGKKGVVVNVTLGSTKFRWWILEVFV